MLYKSTRGESPIVPFSDVLLGGLAPDGGLYMPESFPKFSIDEINSWSNLEFHELASKILFPFVEGEIEKDVFNRLVKESYEVFDIDEVVALKKLDENRWVLELFHGPTLAFKDIAMQMLGQFFEHVLEKKRSTLNILGATSGDTGSAAEYAMRDKSNISVFMLSPEGRMSSFQKAF